MTKIAKIAISLPEEILSVVERERKESGESRSQFFRRAIETLLRQQHERELTSRYIRGYQRIPEASEEVEAAYHAASTILAKEPWE